MKARTCAAFLTVTMLAFLAGAAFAAARPRPVAMIRLEGTVDVPSAGYLARALEIAEGNGSQALLILLDTPGGLVKPMTDMTKAMLNSPLPTIVYVSPAGAYAMSAGTFVTMAADVAAMHPATSIGAAHPVELFGAPAPEGEKEQKSAEAMTRDRERLLRAGQGHRRTPWAQCRVGGKGSAAQPHRLREGRGEAEGSGSAGRGCERSAGESGRAEGDAARRPDGGAAHG